MPKIKSRAQALLVRRSPKHVPKKRWVSKRTGARKGGRIWRLPDVLKFSGFKKTQLQQKIDNGEFPPPIQLSDSGRAKGWIEGELIEWQDERIAARDAEAAA